MANMDGIESAALHLGNDTGGNVSKKIAAQSNSSMEMQENAKTIQKTFKDTGDQQQGVQDSKKSKKQKEVTPQQLKEAVEEANRQARMKRTSLEFTYYEELNRYSVKVKDKETDEVIHEYPSEDSLKVLENIWKLAGIIVDESI